MEEEGIGVEGKKAVKLEAYSTGPNDDTLTEWKGFKTEDRLRVQTCGRRKNYCVTW